MKFKKMKEIIKYLIIFFLIIIIILLEYFLILVIPKLFLINNKNNIIKKVLISNIFKKTRKKINNISNLFIEGKACFGNFFLSINNAIIYCEFLGCKKIIIDYNYKFFINRTIFYKKRNFTIETNQTFDSRENLVINIYFFLFSGFPYLRNKNRINIFKNELLNNLPKVVTNPYDLYIYIRSGDIFQNIRKSMRNYYQPPLCFYAKILDIFKFRKIFIISQDELNPTIPKLLSKYSYIKKLKNNLKLDISYLINSYNIVSAKSTFFYSSVKLNDNLKFLWEYNFNSKSLKEYLDFHYNSCKFPIYYTIYKMDSSPNYIKVIYPWINSPKQRKIMIEEICLNNFDIIIH